MEEPVLMVLKDTANNSFLMYLTPKVAAMFEDMEEEDEEEEG